MEKIHLQTIRVFLDADWTIDVLEADGWEMIGNTGPSIVSCNNGMAQYGEKVYRFRRPMSKSSPP